MSRQLVGYYVAATAITAIFTSAVVFPWPGMPVLTRSERFFATLGGGGILTMLCLAFLIDLRQSRGPQRGRPMRKRRSLLGWIGFACMAALFINAVHPLLVLFAFVGGVVSLFMAVMPIAGGAMDTFYRGHRKL